jgi:hypothetical protein
MTRHKRFEMFALWDWRSIRIGIFTLLILVVGLAIIFRIRGYVRDTKGKDMTVHTKGVLLSTETIEERRQGKLGTRTIATAVKIKYQYTVNPTFSPKTVEILFGVDIIPIENEYNSFFESLKKDPNRLLTIKFDPRDPLKSQVDTER